MCENWKTIIENSDDCLSILDGWLAGNASESITNLGECVTEERLDLYRVNPNTGTAPINDVTRFSRVSSAVVRERTETSSLREAIELPRISHLQNN